MLFFQQCFLQCGYLTSIYLSLVSSLLSSLLSSPIFSVFYLTSSALFSLLSSPLSLVFFFNFLFALSHTLLFCLFFFCKVWNEILFHLFGFGVIFSRLDSAAVYAGVETHFNDTTRVRPRHRLTFESLDREDRLLLVSLAGKRLSASSGDVCVPIFFLPHPEWGQWCWYQWHLQSRCRSSRN